MRRQQAAASTDVPALDRPLAALPEWLCGFRELAAPERYVARPETDRVLREALGHLAEPGLSVALLAPPGFGKTLLLRRIAEEVRTGFHAEVLPYAAVGPDDLAQWLLARLSARGRKFGALIDRLEGRGAASALLALLRALHDGGSGLFVGIDDAGGMPVATARRLGQWVEQSGGGLRCVLASCDDASASRVVAAVGAGVRRVRWSQAMTPEETTALLRARLSQCAAPAAIADRVDPAFVARVHRLSGGVPRLVERMAAW